MENHSECSLCVHNAYLVDEDKQNIGIVKTSDGNEKISIKDVLVQGGDFYSYKQYFC